MPRKERCYWDERRGSLARWDVINRAPVCSTLTCRIRPKVPQGAPFSCLTTI